MLLLLQLLLLLNTATAVLPYRLPAGQSKLKGAD
jgi:quinol-cytochrome oxidoreductase complex cytochrome b subunit